MKVLHDLKDVLEEQIKTITKKNDITPTELDSVKKALEVMVMADHVLEEKQMQETGSNSNHYPYYWQRPEYAYGNSYGMRSMDNMRGNSMDGMRDMGNSMDTMMGNSMEGMRWNSMDGMRSMNSYDDMHSRDGRRGRDGDGDGRYSEDYSGRRGRDAMGRYTSRGNDKEIMVARLEDMLDDAKTERERKTIEKCLDKIDR